MARKASAAKPRIAPARNSTLDLARLSVREVNQLLHDADGGDFLIENPRGLHAIAAGLDGDFNVTIDGHVGYYCAGMNKHASVTINGNAGTGRRREHDVGPRAREGRRLAVGGRHGLRRPADHRRQRFGALRHLAAGASTSSSRARSATCRRSWRRPATWSCSAMPARRWAIPSTRRGSTCAASVKSLGADCVAKDMRDEHKAALRRLLDAAGRRRRGRCGRVPPLRLGAQALPLPHRQPGVLLMSGDDDRWMHTPPRKSATFDRHAIAEIHRAAATGIYDIRGFGAKRRLPHFDDLLFLGASISRYPLEGYREKCATDVTLGTRYAKKPITLKIPITIAGMSFGSLSAPAKEALGRGASRGRHLHHDRRRRHDARRSASIPRCSSTRCCPRATAWTPTSCARPTPSRWWSGRAPSPAAAACCSARRSPSASPRCARCREGIDQRSACRHPDWTGPDDLEIKIHELREITDWEKPIYVKVGAARPYYDTALAVKAGADVVVLDGMQGGTAATQDVFIEHCGIPTLAAIRPAVQALQELGMHRKVQLIVSGGIRSGADVAKALALGADAVSIGTAALIALGDNDPRWEDEYRKLGTTAGCYDDWHEGRDPAGITTQDPDADAAPRSGRWPASGSPTICPC